MFGTTSHMLTKFPRNDKHKNIEGSCFECLLPLTATDSAPFSLVYITFLSAIQQHGDGDGSRQHSYAHNNNHSIGFHVCSRNFICGGDQKDCGQTLLPVDPQATT